MVFAPIRDNDTKATFISTFDDQHFYFEFDTKTQQREKMHMHEVERTATKTTLS